MKFFVNCCNVFFPIVLYVFLISLTFNTNAGVSPNSNSKGDNASNSAELTQNPNKAPIPPTIKGPDDYNTIGKETSAKLVIQATDPENDKINITFYGREVSTKKDFRIVVYPDTQHWEQVQPMFLNTADFIISLHPAAVFQVGDLINNGDEVGKEWQWEKATAVFSKFENKEATKLKDGIPYLITVGNHEQKPKSGNCNAPTRMFKKYFPVSRYSNRSYWGGAYSGDTDNRWIKFSGGGMDFMAVSLEYNAGGCLQDRLDWADSVFQKNKNRRGIVVTHSILKGDGSWTPAGLGNGYKTYKSMADNSNVFMMLCGHAVPDFYRNEPYKGRDVHILLFDYQDGTVYDPYGGWLRVLEFSPSTNQINVRTVRTWIEDDPCDPNIGHPVKMWDVNSHNRFTINYNMNGKPEKFKVIGTAKNIESESETAATWSNLKTGKTYEWYAVINDGNSETTGPKWRFNTIYSKSKK